MELDTIERVDATRMSYTEFVDRFERAYKPVILIGITDQWRANDHWNLQVLFLFKSKEKILKNVKNNKRPEQNLYLKTSKEEP